MTLFVVEDNQNIRLTLIDFLEMEGIEAIGFETIAEAKSEWSARFASDKQPNGIVLDVMLPDGNGYEYAKWLRQKSYSGFILMLTARELEQDLVEGFRSGADDYMTKPFSNLELLVRVKALMRRTSSNTLIQSDEQPLLIMNSVQINWALMSAEKDGDTLKLSTRAIALLKYLYQNKNNACSRQDILDNVWGKDVYVDERTIDNFISQLKKAFDFHEGKPFHLKTIRGVGYSLIGK
jgi:DNA-binding response OmpR family regulator